MRMTIRGFPGRERSRAPGVLRLGAPCADALTIELFDSRAVRGRGSRAAPPCRSRFPSLRIQPAASGPVKAPAHPPVAARSASYDASSVSPSRPHDRRPPFALAAPVAPSTLADQLSAKLGVCSRVPHRRLAAGRRPARSPSAASVRARPRTAPPRSPSAAPAPAASRRVQAARRPGWRRPGSLGGQPRRRRTAGFGRSTRGRVTCCRWAWTAWVSFSWVFQTRQADGMSFKTKENRNNKTWFTFQALKLGTYRPRFPATGQHGGKDRAKETVRVHVVSDQDFNAAVAPQPGPDSPGASAAAESGDPAFAHEALDASGPTRPRSPSCSRGTRTGTLP